MHFSILLPDLPMQSTDARAVTPIAMSSE